MAEAFVIHASWVVPVEPPGALQDHAVVVRDGRIEALLPGAEARVRYGSLEHLVLENRVLAPGLVNAHTHAAMTLARGADDDRALRDWLELAPATPPRVREGALRACAEMLAGGITCFTDVTLFPEASLDAALEAGLRSVQGLLVSATPSAYAADADDYLRKGLALRDRARDEPRASFCIAPHPLSALSDAALRQSAALAAELDLPVHAEIHKPEDLARAHRAGLVGPAFMAVHSPLAAAQDIELLARHGASVVHCPSSSLRRAGGVPPLAALAAAGVNIALGTDATPGNDRLDLFQEMRNAALLAKSLARDPRTFPAAAALRAATLGGAWALGLHDRIGSIAAGKEADLIAVEIGRGMSASGRDPIAHLVYAAGRENVSHAWVAGRPVWAAGKLLSPVFSGLDTGGDLWQNPPARAGS